MKATWLVRILTVLVIAVLAIPVPAAAAEFRGGEETTTVPAAQTVEDDLYVAGQTVTINGTINGDLVAAGSDVTIDGTVTGSVWVVGGTVTINGTVGHSLRIGAGNVTVNGKVAGDVLAGAGQLTVGKGAEIGRDLVVGAGSLTQNALVGRNLKFAADQITVAGTVKGSVQAQSGERFILEPTAVIGGAVDYSGPRELTREQGAQIGGAVDYTKTERQSQPNSLAERLYGQLYWFLASLLLLIAMLLYARRAAVRGADLIGERPGVVVLAGLAFLILAPVVGFILLITLVGFPLSVITFLGYWLVLYTAKLFPALALGRAVFRRAQRDSFWPVFGAGALGLALFYLLAALPGIGWLVNLAAVLFGVGAQLLLFRELYASVKKKYGA